MALRRFIFQNTATGSAYLDSNVDTDELSLARLSIVTGVTGVGLDLGNTDIANGRDFAARKITLATGVSGVTVDAGGFRVTGVATPTQASDAVTKAYVDNLNAGVDWKGSVRAASTGNVTIATAPAAIDGVTLTSGDRVLLKDQTAGAENGIYVFNGVGAAMTRAVDAATTTLTSGAAAFIEAGSTNADSGWILTTNDPFTVGTTSLAFVQFTALGQTTAGAGMTKNGSTIDIGKGDGIGIAADSIYIDLTANGGLALTGSSPNKTLGVVIDGSTGATQLSAGGAVQVKIQANTGLSIGANGLAGVANTAQSINVGASGIGISLMSTPGLQHSTGLGVLIDPNTGLQVVAAGIGIKVVANTGLAVSSSGTSVVVNNAEAIHVDANGVGLSLYGSNPGLAFNGNTLDVKYGNGLIASANGVTHRLEATNPTLTQVLGTGTNELGVKVFSGSGLAGSASGLGVVVGNGLQISTNSVVPKLVATGGLQVDGNGISILYESTQLFTDATGLHVVGVPSLFKVNNVATSANVTAANLNTLTDGSSVTTLHTHPNLTTVNTLGSIAVAFSSSAGTGGVTKGDPVYFSSAGAVNKGDPSLDAKSVVIGLAASTVAAAGAVLVQTTGVLAGAGTGWTAGQQIFLGSSVALTNDPVGGITSRHRTIQAGVALNSTDLLVDIRDYGRKP